jgi:hypothetical protein
MFNANALIDFEAIRNRQLEDAKVVVCALEDFLKQNDNTQEYNDAREKLIIAFADLM